MAKSCTCMSFKMVDTCTSNSMSGWNLIFILKNKLVLWKTDREVTVNPHNNSPNKVHWLCK